MNLAKKMEKQDAINEAVDWACAQNLLDGFFREHKAMVTAVSLTEFDQELYDKCRREEGFIEGQEEKAVEATIKMLQKNYPSSDISEITGLPIEKVLELQQQLTAKS